MPDSSRHQPTIRVLDVLERLASAPQGLSLTALAADTGFSKSTLFPIMKTLLARRYIRLAPDTLRYLWGVGGIALAGAGMAAAPWLSAINDEMRAVVQGCGEVCQMGVLEGRDILYVAKVEAKRQVRLLSQVGKRLPANCTALGRLCLPSSTAPGWRRSSPTDFRASPSAAASPWMIWRRAWRRCAGLATPRMTANSTRRPCAWPWPCASAGGPLPQSACRCRCSGRMGRPGRPFSACSSRPGSVWRPCWTGCRN